MVYIQKINSLDYQPNFKAKNVAKLSQKALKSEYNKLFKELLELQRRQSALIADRGFMATWASDIPKKIKTITNKLKNLEKLIIK